mmetsp:Transcript_3144/g.7460  ORF Transcript_3144/g.7460 Transcript_3144/m.7460 type:complete len:86 (+) Transcript_3144:94-351(+)
MKLTCASRTKLEIIDWQKMPLHKNVAECTIATIYSAVIIETPMEMQETMLIKNPIHLMNPPFLYRAILTSREVSMYPFWYKIAPA